MERLVKFFQDQQVTNTDLNNIGLFDRTSIDHVVNDGIEGSRKFWGFPVSETAALEVTVGEGRFYNAGKVYFRNDDGGVELSLADFVPVVTNRIITVAVWGNEIDTAVQPRTFLTDVETLQTEAEAVATESRRHAEINLVAGTEAVDAQPPALDANVLAVAHVLMSPAGITSITAVEDNRIISASANAADLKVLKLWQALVGQRLDTLASDLAALAARMHGMVRRENFNEVAADVARLKDLADLPDDLVSYAADHFLDRSESDDQHADWLARIEEGVRFPAAQSSLAQILLLNQFEERVKVHPDGLILPAYTEAKRISVTGNDGEVSVAQYSVQSVDTVQKTRTKCRHRYGTSFKVCTNKAWWESGIYDSEALIFTRDGDTFQVEVVEGTRQRPKWVRLKQVWIDCHEENYWERVIITDTVQGAVIGQTFLASQAGWVTSVNLYFTKKGSTGDVHLLLTETTNGSPDVSKVIGTVTLSAADIKLYPEATKVPIPPTQLDVGRYALVLITPGNHFVSVVNNNKFAEGSLFFSTDSAWFMGDLLKDLAFEVVYAEFDQPRVEVQMQPLTLENGIANIDIIAEMVKPSGTELFFEIQVNGVWRRLNEPDSNLLNGLPALLPFRLVFIGTTDNHTGIATGAPSTTLTWRPRTDFKHVSATRILPSSCDEVEVRILAEWWDAARHTLLIQLLIDGSPNWSQAISPDSVEEIPLLNVEGVEDRVEFRAHFVGISPALDEYKIRLTGTTDNALVTYHVAERVDIGFSGA